MNPTYHGESGMYFLLASKAPKCILCKTYLVKKHGLVKDGDGGLKEPYQVIGWFLGHSGPRCLWCHTEAWRDQEFWRRTGHSSDTAYSWQGDIHGQFDEMALQMAKKHYPNVPTVKLN